MLNAMQLVSTSACVVTAGMHCGSVLFELKARPPALHCLAR